MKKQQYRFDLKKAGCSSISLPFCCLVKSPDYPVVLGYFNKLANEQIALIKVAIVVMNVITVLFSI